MSFIVPIEDARLKFPQYKFVCALTPSVQKAAFHVKDASGQDLCLKIVAPDCDLSRLEREIRALQLLRHSNVARLREYVFETKDGDVLHYVVEEFVHGHDLAFHLRENDQWSLDRARAFFIACCSGLTALHDRNIVHRDLKPSNIRVRPDDTPVIVDLGVARHLDLPDITSTEEGAAWGTPAYFAPEQFSGTKYDIDRRTDLFTLGILLYQALVGTHPFYKPGMTRLQLREAICDRDDHRGDSRFEALPAGWRVIVSRLLEKERARRPFSAAQVAVILGKIGGA